MPNPRVIVVGCGPVGMLASVLLSRAGIDFITLEKSNNIIPSAGGVLTAHASLLKTLYDLGLREQIERLSTPFVRWEVLRPGRAMHVRSGCFDIYKEK